MYKEISIIENEISQNRLMSYVSQISQYHRVQASPTYREAANWVHKNFLNNGVQSKIHKYKSEYGLTYMERPAFDEWEIKSANLTMVKPFFKTLADYDACATSIFQRSFEYNSDTPIPIVLLDKGNQKQAYETIDINGKIIFVRDDPMPYVDWAIKEKGAIGIITDFVLTNATRDRHDLYDTTRYTAFWYTKEPQSKPFGFVLTPREGDQLAQLCKDESIKGLNVYVTVNIEASFYKGEIEVVEATLQGETKEEIWILSHLCHPKTCANDNASGNAANIEAICVLNNLINKGILPKPMRTIKAVFMPEFSGTLPYVEEFASSNVMAGLNLDMVGAKQDKGYGAINIIDLPITTPSFVAHLATIIMDSLKKTGDNLGKGGIAMFNSQRAEFSVGSDHMILCDPLVGIPTPMINQWPDKFYHTSGDDISVISPYILAKSASLAAIYAYKIATLSENDITPLLAENIKRFSEYIADDPKHLAIYKDFYIGCISDIKRFLPNSKIDDHINLIEKIAVAFSDTYNIPSTVAKIEGAVPIRLSKGIIMNYEDYAITEKQKKMLKHFKENWAIKHMGIETGHYIVQFLINGKRTVDEIAELSVFANKEGTKDGYIHFLELYRELGFCKF